MLSVGNWSLIAKYGYAATGRIWLFVETTVSSRRALAAVKTVPCGRTPVHGRESLGSSDGTLKAETCS